jgi:hypothetical protein
VTTSLTDVNTCRVPIAAEQADGMMAPYPEPSLYGPEKPASAHTSAAEKLELDARPRDDGSVLVQVKYEETSPEGARIDWRPAVRLAHGATARAEVNGAGWGRVLEVAVE